MSKGYVAPVAAILILAMLSGCISSSGCEFELVGFDYERAYDDVVELCKYPHRLTGSQYLENGMAYFVDEMKDAGLEAHIEYYPLTCFDILDASLALVRYDLLGLIPIDKTEFRHGDDFIVQGFSGSTDGAVVASIAFAGNGTEQAYEEAGNVSGKAVVISYEQGGAGYNAAYLNAARNGAALNVMQNRRYNPASGYPPIGVAAGAYDENGNYVPYPDIYPDLIIPTIMVSNATGNAIRNATSGGFSLFSYKLEFDIDVLCGMIREI
ncbi:MAG: hypothetical protein CVT48_05055 [Thermoplasmata archaeon HGW-Thermoplasmata-1]|nr:MAG: hypothetical protein CVT48_05055 [Thermoplasmata archaeon HGW-Thermoplasmata-1]